MTKKETVEAAQRREALLEVHFTKWDRFFGAYTWEDKDGSVWYSQRAVCFPLAFIAILVGKGYSYHRSRLSWLFGAFTLLDFAHWLRVHIMSLRRQ